MNDTPTPMTDAEHAQFPMGGFTLDFARKLECQRNELVRIARDYIEDLNDSGDEAKAKDYRRWLNRIIGENVIGEARAYNASSPQNQTL